MWQFPPNNMLLYVKLITIYFIYRFFYPNHCYATIITATFIFCLPSCHSLLTGLTPSFNMIFSNPSSPSKKKWSHEDSMSFPCLNYQSYAIALRIKSKLLSSVHKAFTINPLLSSATIFCSPHWSAQPSPVHGSITLPLMACLTLPVSRTPPH